MKHYIILTFSCLLTSYSSGSVKKIDIDSSSNRVLNTKAEFKLNLVDCLTILEMIDKTIFYDSSGADTLDFISSWFIDWGDGSRPIILERKSSAEPSISDGPVHHYYFQRGDYVCRYIIKTKKGLVDSSTHNITMPGPMPFFKFKGTNDRHVKVGLGECASIINTTKKYTNSAYFHVFFGDGKYTSIRGVTPDDIEHCYTKAGIYYVTLQMLDSVNYNGLRYGVCPVIWPDTSFQPAMKVEVIEGLGLNNINQKPLIFPNPTSSIIHIKGYASRNIEVINHLGQTLKKVTLVNDSLDLSSLETGIYYLYDAEQLIYIGKFIKL